MVNRLIPLERPAGSRRLLTSLLQPSIALRCHILLVIIVTLVAMVTTFLFATPLHAQNDIQTTTGTEVDTSAISADEVNIIARELWCPLCSGVRLDSCELKACEQMKEVIAIKLAEGEELDSIRTYFVAQYGPQVLGEPPLEGFNWLAWILPFVVLAIGGYVLWTTVKRRTSPLPAAGAVHAATDNGNASSNNGSNHSNDTISDEYETKLAEELKRYD